MELSDRDIDGLAAAVDLILDMLDKAEQTVSFPKPGEEPDRDDDANEEAKRENIRLYRPRFESIRAKLDGDEVHGIPVDLELLEKSLGIFPTFLPEDREGDQDEDFYVPEPEGHRRH